MWWCTLIINNSYIDNKTFDLWPLPPLCAYLAPRSGDPLQTFIFGTTLQDTGLLGFGSELLSTHAIRQNHCTSPRVRAMADHAAFPQSAATGLGALWRRRDEKVIIYQYYDWIKCVFTWWNQWRKTLVSNVFDKVKNNWWNLEYSSWVAFD